MSIQACLFIYVFIYFLALWHLSWRSQQPSQPECVWTDKYFSMCSFLGGCSFDKSPVGARQQPVLIGETLQVRSVQKHLSLLKQPLWAETASQLRRAKNISCSIHGFETPSKVVIKSHELPFDPDTVSIQSNIATTGKEYCMHDCFWVHRAVAHLNSRTVCGKPDRLLAKSGEETVQPCTWPLECFSALSLCNLVTHWILK